VVVQIDAVRSRFRLVRESPGSGSSRWSKVAGFDHHAGRSGARWCARSRFGRVDGSAEVEKRVGPPESLGVGSRWSRRRLEARFRAPPAAGRSRVEVEGGLPAPAEPRERVRTAALAQDAQGRGSGRSAEARGQLWVVSGPSPRGSQTTRLRRKADPRDIRRPYRAGPMPIRPATKSVAHE
jgi:hypothetical protein